MNGWHAARNGTAANAVVGNVQCPKISRDINRGAAVRRNEGASVELYVIAAGWQWFAEVDLYTAETLHIYIALPIGLVVGIQVTKYFSVFSEVDALVNATIAVVDGNIAAFLDGNIVDADPDKEAVVAQQIIFTVRVYINGIDLTDVFMVAFISDVVIPDEARHEHELIVAKRTHDGVAVSGGEGDPVPAVGMEGFGDAVEHAIDPAFDIVDEILIFLWFWWVAVDAAVCGEGDGGEAVVIDADWFGKIKVPAGFFSEGCDDGIWCELIDGGGDALQAVRLADDELHGLALWFFWFFGVTKVALHDGCYLCAGGAGLWIDGGGGHATHEAFGIGPGENVFCPAADACGIGVFAEIGTRGNVPPLYAV